MNVRLSRAVAVLALALVPLSAGAQNVRYESEGTAYVLAQDQLIAERVVSRVLGASPGPSSQIVFFRGNDEVPVQMGLSGAEGTLAMLPSGAFYAIAVAPGSHIYRVDGEELSLQLAPGERSYIRIGDDHANPQLRTSNALTFLRLVTGKREPLYASN